MSDIKSQVKEGVTEANQTFLGSLKAELKDLITGDPALRQQVKELTDKIAGVEAANKALNEQIVETAKLHAKEISDLKATHATEITTATNKAQTDLTKTGHSRVPADAGTSTSSSDAVASNDIEKCRAELAALEGKYDAASEAKKNELLAKIKQLKNPEAKAKQ